MNLTHSKTGRFDAGQGFGPLPPRGHALYRPGQYCEHRAGVERAAIHVARGELTIGEEIRSEFRLDPEDTLDGGFLLQ